MTDNISNDTNSANQSAATNESATVDADHHIKRRLGDKSLSGGAELLARISASIAENEDDESAESGDEAKAAQDACARLGLDCQVLRWRGEKLHFLVSQWGVAHWRQQPCVGTCRQGIPCHLNGSVGANVTHTHDKFDGSNSWL